MFSFSKFTSSTFERAACVGSDDLGLPQATRLLKTELHSFPF